MSRIARFFADHEMHLFAALILLHLLPVWSVAYFPSQDGAAHLFNADVIREYNHPGRTDLRQYFDLTRDPDPYWTSDLTLAFLMGFFSPAVSEKILVSLYLVLFALAVRYLVRSVNPDRAYVSWLIFPFLLNWWLHVGFYNYCLGFIPFAFLLGYWLRRADTTGVHKIPILVASSLAAYYTHPGASVMLCIDLSILVVWTVLLDLLYSSGRRWQAARTNVVRRSEELLGLGPFLIFLQTFLRGFLEAPPRQIIPRTSFSHSWYLLHDFWLFTSFGDADVWVLRIVFILFVGLLATTLAKRLRSGRAERADGFFFMFAANLSLFFLLTYFELVSPRALLFAVVAVIAYFASVERGRAVRAGIQICVILCSIVMVSNTLTHYRRLNAYVKDVMSCAPKLEPGRTLLYLCLERRGLDPWDKKWMKFQAMRHVGNRLAVERGLTSMNDYEGTERFLPVQYKQRYNPYVHLVGYQESDEPGLDLLQYTERTGGSIDYVVVWGATPENLKKPFGEYMIPQLFIGYDMVYKSPLGVCGMFRKKRR